MRATINGIEVEGTATEIAALLQALAAKPEQTNHASSRDQKAHDTEDFAFRVLKRRPLSTEQKQMLSLLHRNHPEWTLATQLHKATKYSPNQFAGLLGAFGKRTASTEGFEGGLSLIDSDWDYENDCYKYRLTACALAAVKRAGL